MSFPNESVHHIPSILCYNDLYDFVSLAFSNHAFNGFLKYIQEGGDANV